MKTRVKLPPGTIGFEILEYAQSIRCWYCLAHEGDPCKSKTGKPRRDPHQVRWLQARDFVIGVLLA